jgi:murein endopeptidase
MLSETENTALMRTVLNTADQQNANAAWQAVLEPLPSANQRQGYHIGFFEQGVFTGGLVALFSSAATISAVGYYGLTYVRRSRIRLFRMSLHVN